MTRLHTVRTKKPFPVGLVKKTYVPLLYTSPTGKGFSGQTLYSMNIETFSSRTCKETEYSSAIQVPVVKVSLDRLYTVQTEKLFPVGLVKKPCMPLLYKSHL